MFHNIRDDVQIGDGTYIAEFVNLYGCTIGKDCRIGAFVEIQRGVIIGDRCKVSSHSFLCTGVTLADDVFIGHGVIFTNDKYPVASRDGRVTVQGEGEVLRTQVGRGVSIGSGATILPVTIGDGARIGAGAVVTRDVPAGELVVGNPVRAVEPGRYIRKDQMKRMVPL